MENVYQSMTYSCRPVPILLRGLRGQLVPKLVLLCRFVLAIVVKNVFTLLSAGELYFDEGFFLHC